MVPRKESRWEDREPGVLFFFFFFFGRSTNYNHKLSSSIVQIMYGGLETQDAAIITLPLVLYQGSQVVLGQIAVAILKAWVNRLAKRCVDVEEAPIAKAGDRDPTMVEESAPVMDSQK